MKIIVISRGPYDIYIGRPGPYGNPFIIGRDGTREQVISKCDAYLDAHFEIVEQLRAECAALGKDVVRLKCFCSPLACHGDLYKQRLEKLCTTRSGSRCYA